MADARTEDRAGDFEDHLGRMLAAYHGWRCAQGGDSDAAWAEFKYRKGKFMLLIARGLWTGGDERLADTLERAAVALQTQRECRS